MGSVGQAPLPDRWRGKACYFTSPLFKGVIKLLSNKTKSGDFTVPNTKDDMEALDTWWHGKKVYGSFAKMTLGEKNYRNDINKAWGKAGQYKKNTIYIDTLKPIQEQLKKYK